MIKTKIFANYLPQFYANDDNDAFWGKGFTDWSALKNATPQYPGHKQPIVPFNKYYYDLSDPLVLKWQAELAKKNRIDGFCIYHYWFKDGKKALNVPGENLLTNKEIGIEYFFAWDNHSWTRSWSGIKGNSWAPSFDGVTKTEKEILLEVNYGDKSEWEKHFMYLLPFFQDERYLKINNKPVFVIFTDINNSLLRKMKEHWNRLASENGIAGISFISQTDCRFFSRSEYFYTYQPSIVWNKKRAFVERVLKSIGFSLPAKLDICDYEFAWKKIVNRATLTLSPKALYCGVVSFDDTPRRGPKARILTNPSPQLFRKYFKRLYRLSCTRNKEIIFLTAWNEWGEGAYLEPSSEYKFKYLEMIKEIVCEFENEKNECS